MKKLFVVIFMLSSLVATSQTADTLVLREISGNCKDLGHSINRVQAL